MARPLSEDRRNTILMSATVLIAEQGLGASTAEIAKQAGVSNGSVFTYFPTKADLLNALYCELKQELIETVLTALPSSQVAKSELWRFWAPWTRWGVANPEKRKALAHLDVSDQVTTESRRAVTAAAAPVVDLINKAAMSGVLRVAPPNYVGALVEGMASTTMDFMASDPAGSDEVCQAGFEALWRMLT